jgi:muramidase (phage lysozyme)
VSDPIDSLVVSLGLDPKDFISGAQTANAALERLVREQQAKLDAYYAHTKQSAQTAARTQDTLDSQAQRKTARQQAVRQQDDRKATRQTEENTNRVAESFSKLGAATLGLMSIFKVGQGALGFASMLTQADAAAGRLATNLGVNVQKLGGLQNALVKIGGTASEADSGIGSLVGASQQIQMGQMPAAMPYFQMAGVTLNDLQNPQQALDKISDYFKSVGPTHASFVGAQMGLPPDLINLMEGGSKSFEAAWAKGNADAPTKTDAKAAQDLQGELNQVDQDFTEAGRHLKTELTPYLIDFLKVLDQFAVWAKAHPLAAGAMGLGGTVVSGAAGAAVLRRLAKSILGRGGAGAAAEAAEAEAAAGVAAAGGAAVLSPALLAALGVYAASQTGSPGIDPNESTKLHKLFPNAPQGQVATADRTLPQVGQTLLNSVGGSESKNSYNVLYGGSTFSDYSKFPDWAGKQVGTDAQGNPIMTHAAGRYQFEPGTWSDASTALGLTDFSPASQDKAAWWLAQRDYRGRTGRDLTTDLQMHDPKVDALIRRNLSPTWTSLVSRSDSEFASSLSDSGTGSPVPMGQLKHHELPKLDLPSRADHARNAHALLVAKPKGGDAKKAAQQAVQQAVDVSAMLSGMVDAVHADPALNKHATKNHALLVAKPKGGDAKKAAQQAVQQAVDVSAMLSGMVDAVHADPALNKHGGGYAASLHAGTSADAIHGSDAKSPTTSNTTTNSTHVGEVHVHTAATDSEGIAKGLAGAMMRHSWIAQQNTGLA